MKLTDVRRYPYTEIEYEHTTEAVPMCRLRRGDKIVGKLLRPVREIKIGTKWVDTFDSDGKRILRGLRTDQVEVSRKHPTEQTLEIERRVNQNRKLIESLNEDFNKPVIEAIARINTEVQAYGRADYQYIGRLMETQATARVWVWFAQMVEDAEGEAEDLVEVFEAYKETLTERLVSTRENRALSRSTSTIANLMDDCDHAASAEFIAQMQWYY